MNFAAVEPAPFNLPSPDVLNIDDVDFAIIGWKKCSYDGNEYFNDGPIKKDWEEDLDGVQRLEEGLTCVQKVFSEMIAQGYDPVFFSLKDEGYESLSIDFAKAMKLIRQQRSLIMGYEVLLESKNTPAE